MGESYRTAGMVDSCGISRRFALPSVLPIWPCFSDHFLKANLYKYARNRGTIVRLFAGSEHFRHHDLLAEATKAASIRFKDSLRPGNFFRSVLFLCIQFLNIYDVSERVFGF